MVYSVLHWKVALVAVVLLTVHVYIFREPSLRLVVNSNNVKYMLRASCLKLKIKGN